MRSEIKDKKFDAWRHGLLDVSRRNRLMNYRRTKRTTLLIASPDMEELYRRLVSRGEGLTFRRRIDVGDDAKLTRLFYIMDRMDAPVDLGEGEIRSDMSTTDMALTLKNLRAKARLSQEEQGVNILYLSFGFLKWRQKDSDPYMLSPLVLVPVSLNVDSILSPYTVKRLDEDIVVNPTLDHALSSEFGISLPDMDASQGKIGEYLDAVASLVDKNGWSVVREASLGLLSFLKIVMYKDLERHRDRIFDDPVVRAFCGERDALPPVDPQLLRRPHDDVPAAGTCLVVNADASQQDAILLSRNGVSFVLQGPPGTGKSQTITNIIAQALADGKKVLFVSEKMAALSVVYRRLEEAGLSDYCLSLHNYRAERRAVIQDLVNTLDAPARTVRRGVTDALSVLERERASLNAYVAAMNEPRTALDRTIFDVVTELASLKAPGFFRISEELPGIGAREYSDRVALAERLGDFFANSDTDVRNDPWRGTGLRMVTYDVRDLAGSSMLPLAERLRGIGLALEGAQAGYGDAGELTYGRLRNLLAGLVRALVVREAGERIRAPYGAYAFTPGALEALEKAVQRLSSARAAALEKGADAASLADAGALKREIGRLATEAERAKEASDLVRASSRAFGVALPDGSGSLPRAKALFDAVSARGGVPEAWRGRAGSLRKAAEEWRGIASSALALRGKIDQKWERGFYRLDCDGMIARFAGEYTSFFRHFSGQYRADRGALLSVRRGHPSSIEDGECLEALYLLREYREELDRFGTAAADAPAVLGDIFRGIETDWDALDAALAECERAEACAAEHGGALAELMAMPYAGRMARVLGALGAASAEEAASAFDRAIAFFGEGDAPFADSMRGAEKAAALGEYEAAYTALVAAAEPFLADGAAFSAGAEAAAGSLCRMLREAARASEECARFFGGARQDGPEPLVRELEALFTGALLRDRIAAAAEKLKDAYGRLDEAAFRASLAGAEECLARDEALEALLSWFPGMDARSMALGELADRAEGCADVEKLRGWLAYADLERECAQHGMGNFPAYLLDNAIPPESAGDLYRKSFLTKWLMDVLSDDSIAFLRNFRSHAHEKTISDFRGHDREQLGIARARLIGQLSHDKPTGVSALASAMDEVTFLRREAEKKRRVVPLRRLFREIPTLLTKLKPCFMMSPLTVSYFLDSDVYDFDMVIFDEASQILPEDAIGAIYRAKQVVIAGDSKQLPPTSFFTAATGSGDEYDSDADDDEYYPDVISESILDEAAACLPSCTLLWHYRSRDESLIAFSNRQMYAGRLITFPNCSKIEDRGLEYVYVPGGYYEGSGRNCNVPEAQTCVKLVEEHISKYPDRSLGIIAFSEKQQSVIEDAIGDFRLRNPQYESFFDETKDEPFFVKNLENVQGDERDTIIFSICYAKDIQGRMYQRFGPLSHEGGERRLNVAITRAKYNVKLVGSIMPGDIALRDGTGAGVRMLREYIYYAMQNDYRIPAGASRDEEPFADVVAAYLEEQGFTLRRDVGASAYRVDIGVERPGCPDDLMAGIECDGTVYANARTARDRDVLRRDVMASLGWRMYHAWSMAWYLNPEDEKRRLLAFLARCAGTAAGEGEGGENENGEEPEGTDESPAPDADALTEEDEVPPREVAFAQYRYVDPLDAVCRPGDRPLTVLARQILHVMRHEQPIHREELYRRMAPSFGSGKVTQPVRKGVDECIALKLSDSIEARGDFLYLRSQSVEPRTPAPGEEPRSVDRVAPEEIREAMRRILEIAGPLTRRHLIDETARQLGYARTGPRIGAVMEENVAALLDSGVLRENDGKLTLTEVDKG